MPETPSPPLEIGLALAGTISAGAYTAGVVDFLIQALDEWHRVKAERRQQGVAPGEDRECLRHEVRLKVLSGASGGGMTAALAALSLQEEHQPVTSLPALPPSQTFLRNRLYDSWVRRIDVGPLLGTHDLDVVEDDNVRSLLDSTVLDDISAQVYDRRPLVTRPYVANPLHVILTHTNLRGVPYDLAFTGNQPVGLRLFLHADDVCYAVGTQPPRQGVPWLDPSAAERGEEWEAVRMATLGTGAFPLGFAPRMLHRPSSDYVRDWPVPQDPEEAKVCTVPKTIAPSWSDEPFTYHYLVVDGGVLNDEPVELARRHLAGGVGARNERSPQEVQRTLIMIDPLIPGALADEDKRELAQYDVLDVAARLFGSLLNQARFKPDELILALDPDGYSRFLIAPRREIGEDSGRYAVRPLATGSLGAFGGFLSERFRVHDFQLGRRNCQKFLRDWLALPLDAARENPVFAGIAATLDAHRRRRQADGVDVVPLIPLYGSAREEVPAPRLAAPGFTLSPEERSRLEQGLAARLKKLVPRLIKRRMPRGLKLLARKTFRLFAGKLRRRLMKEIDQQLDAWREKAEESVKAPT